MKILYGYKCFITVPILEGGGGGGHSVGLIMPATPWMSVCFGNSCACIEDSCYQHRKTYLLEIASVHGEHSPKHWEENKTKLTNNPQNNPVRRTVLWKEISKNSWSRFCWKILLQGTNISRYGTSILSEPSSLWAQNPLRVFLLTAGRPSWSMAWVHTDVWQTSSKLVFCLLLHLAGVWKCEHAHCCWCKKLDLCCSGELTLFFQMRVWAQATFVYACSLSIRLKIQTFILGLANSSNRNTASIPKEGLLLPVWPQIGWKEWDEERKRRKRKKPVKGDLKKRKKPNRQQQQQNSHAKLHQNNDYWFWMRYESFTKALHICALLLGKKKNCSH